MIYNITDKVSLRAYAILMARRNSLDAKTLVKEAKVIEKYISGEGVLPEVAEDSKLFYKEMILAIKESSSKKDENKMDVNSNV